MDQCETGSLRRNRRASPASKLSALLTRAPRVQGPQLHWQLQSVADPTAVLGATIASGGDDCR